MNTYEVIVSEYSGVVTVVKNGNCFIPVNETNADYEQYLLDTDGGLPLPKGSK